MVRVCKWEDDLGEGLEEEWLILEERKASLVRVETSFHER